ncbi:MAG: diaminopimelate decarboxylase [Clostridiales bacterium]|nr:diaminopimelate decarboxylase [Clostridiales bacterium]
MNERNTLKINNFGHLEIGGADAIELVKNFGTPLYVMDQAHIENVCLAYSEVLNKEYGYGMVAYASKAFSCKEIYRIINSLGLGADVVSGGELYTAKCTGFPTEKIIFHGNNKSEQELIEAVSSNVGIIVVDSFDEVDLLDKISKNANKIQTILIRVNPGIEAHTHHYIQTAKIDSKFGFSIDSGEAEEIIKYVSTKSNLKLKGLHCHIGSQIFEKQSYVLAVDKMTSFYKHIKETLCIEFDILNMGGGFGIWYSDGDAKTTVSDYADYVKLIATELKRNVEKKGLIKPYLILEPGRSIVGEAGITLYSAGNVKEIKGIKNYLAINGGMFENPRFALYQAKYTVKVANKMMDKGVKTYTIAGKCCESGDIIAEDVLLPSVERGDVIAVFSTGAYNYSMASNYNRNFIPPVVMVKDGVARYVVKPQTYEDLVRNDI